MVDKFYASLQEVPSEPTSVEDTPQPPQTAAEEAEKVEDGKEVETEEGEE